MKTVLLFLTGIICLVSSRPSSNYGFEEFSKPKCGYESCHPLKYGVLNVHIVAHTHDDVGWLKTVDQYYYGSRTLTQKAGVQYIIDSVIDELLKDPVRRFVYVETSFFNRWWLEQTENRRNSVRKLVEEGRLEFAGGAWSMNDEAAAHYHSVLDQLTWGLRVLNDTFGECARPKAGWQIDPFGHSRELANMWALSGFDGLLIGRVDYQDRRQRTADKDLEMLWRGSDDLGKPSDILTGIMYNTYSPPPGFCFDILCADEPFIDDKKSPDYNVDRLVNNFVNYVDGMEKAYKSNNVIVTMGGDFTYQDALVWYKNLDKLIKYVNERVPRMNLIYSTPGCYIKSLYDSNTAWSPKVDDFFPYASDPHSYWTGYFTSRPNSKFFERRGNNFLQICKQLSVMTNLQKDNESRLESLRSAMGIMQHHDAITGTEKQHVADDYHRILETAIDDCLEIATEGINKLMSAGRSESVNLPMTMCHLNDTECVITEKSKNFIVTIYNPMGQDVDEYVRLPVTGKNYEVRDGTGMMLKSEVIPLDEEAFTRQGSGKKLTATGELTFDAFGLPRVGYKSYYVTEIHDNSVKAYKEQEDDELSITNGKLTVNLNPSTGLVDNVVMKIGEETVTIPLVQELMYYNGMAGNNSIFANRASGAYIFRPNGTNPNIFTEKPENKIYKGKRVQEIHQKFSSWATQTVRLYQGESHIEFEWLVGPIPIEDKIGKEVIMRYTTDFETNGEFYTDANGRQMLKRTRNKRPTWDLELEEPVAGNYYPVTSMISVKDAKSGLQMFVLNDRAQGGGSLRDGQVELMVHRRLLYDDAFGVGEPLNETISGVGLVAKGTHYVGFGPSTTIAHDMRLLALKKLLQPAIFLTSADDITLEGWKNNKNEFNGVNDLHQHIHVLTLEPWKDNSILLRLENYLQKYDHPESKEVTVDLNKLFTSMRIVRVRETLLAASQWKDEASQLRWKSTLEDAKMDVVKPEYVQSDIVFEQAYPITLAPMEIRTFVIEVEPL